jgi:hypothetical protein
MSPGAGAELKHLLDGVKSKTTTATTTTSEGLDLKAEGVEAKALDLKDKGIDLKPETLNLKALGEAVKGANSNRQTVAVWSPKISAVLWYLKKTTPEFSISDEARIILEEGLARKYPELSEQVKKALAKK